LNSVNSNTALIKVSFLCHHEHTLSSARFRRFCSKYPSSNPRNLNENYDSNANDQLIMEVVEQKGHPILVAAIEYLHSSSLDHTEEDALLCFTRLLEYNHKKPKKGAERPHICLSIGRSWSAL
jgi:hypothetical protein